MEKTIGKKVGVISLGCDKNRVDTEKMLAILSKKHKLTSDVAEAEIIIVNTCAFLESSRKEAIEEILWASSLKGQGVEKIIMTITSLITHIVRFYVRYFPLFLF